MEKTFSEEIKNCEEKIVELQESIDKLNFKLTFKRNFEKNYSKNTDLEVEEDVAGLESEIGITQQRINSLMNTITELKTTPPNKDWEIHKVKCVCIDDDDENKKTYVEFKVEIDKKLIEKLKNDGLSIDFESFKCFYNDELMCAYDTEDMDLFSKTLSEHTDQWRIVEGEIDYFMFPNLY